jgi:recombination associated protein RdgC
LSLGFLTLKQICDNERFLGKSHFMWFKNLVIYRFNEPFTHSAEGLADHLQADSFRPCGGHDLSSFGWTAPLGEHSEQLVHACNGFLMVCVKKQEKVIPSSVINELLQEKVADIEAQEARKLGNKERSRIKDELIFELLPKAFRFSRKTFAYIDPKGGWLVVDAGSSKKAEEVVSLLRKSLGSLPVSPLASQCQPSVQLTDWLTQHKAPHELLIEDECELRSEDEEASIIRCKRHDLSLPEIKNHLDKGKQVIKLALTWADRLSFVVDEQLLIKRLKFLDLIQEQRDNIDSTNFAEQFDAEFAIMSAELSQFIPRLTDLFNAEGNP